MNVVFNAGLLSDVTQPALERARAAVLQSKQSDPVAVEHEAVRAGVVEPSVLAWNGASVQSVESGEDVAVTVRIPVTGGISALAYFPGASRWLIPDGLGGVQYQGSPWAGYSVTCSRVFGPGSTPGAVDEWRRNWSKLLDERVAEANDLIAKHNRKLRAEVRRMVAARTGTSARVEELKRTVDGRIDI